MQSSTVSEETLQNEEKSQATEALNLPVESTFTTGDAEVYRSVSRSAVASLVLGVLGLTAFPMLPMVVLPLIGCVFAILAFRGFMQFPDELLGRPLAIAGGILCGLTLIAAPSYHGYVYATEVPDGYTRIDFGALMSEAGQPDGPTRFAMEMNGEKVFVKGYIHPTSMDTLQAKRFVIVPDLGTCCFGGQPPLTHMIEVSLLGDQTARKSLRRQRLAGTLRVDPNLRPIDGLTGVFYQLRADIIK